MENKQKQSFYTRLVEKMEKSGNKLPSPFIMFLYITIALLVITTVLSLFHVHVHDPNTNQEVFVKSFFTKEGFSWFFPNFLNNVMNYAPFGLVLLVSVAVGLAEQVGLFPVVIKRTLMNVPPFLLTVVVCFVAIVFNFAGDAVIIVVPSLAGLIFYMIGRNPVVGILAGYAVAGGVFGSNIIVTSYDALLYPLTNAALPDTASSAQHVTMVSNWYFFAASCIIFTLVGTFITIKFIEPKFKNIALDNVNKEELECGDITPVQRKGLRNVIISIVIFFAILLAFIVPKNGLLRGPDGGLIDSPFMDGIPFVIFAFFVVIAMVYGVTTKHIKKTEDVPAMFGEAVASLKGFIATVIILAQFIAIFNWSNLGKVIALGCYHAATNIGINGIWMLFALVIITMITSIFIASASAMWSMFAPMFIPMLMLMGFSPAITQAAFRVGGPILTIVSPFMVYIPIIMTYIGKYTKKFNVGMLITSMIPYAIGFFLVWIVQLIVWIVFNLPLGPGAGIYI